MDGLPVGLIELALIVGLLGWATWGVVKNRRELDAIRRKRTDGDEG